MNNIYNNNSNSSISTILDYTATSDKTTSYDDEANTLICPELKVKYAICEKCNISFLINMGCNKRTCPVCQKRRAKKLYINKIGMCEDWIQGKNGNIIQFLTLTNKNVAIMDKDYINVRDKALKKFLLKLKKMGFIVDYGFFNKEMVYHKIGEPRYFKGVQHGVYTESNYGYHYHFHILFYGPRIDFKVFNPTKEWLSLTKDSYMVKLKNNFENADHALRYLLKYACKTQETTTEMSIYYSVSKNKRYFQSFGKKYKAKSMDKLKFICSNCGGELKSILFYGRKFMLFDTPQGEVKKFNFRRIRYYMSIKVMKTKDTNSIQIDIDEYQSENQKLMLEHLKLIDGISMDTDQFMQLTSRKEKEIEKWKLRGIIYETKPGFIRWLK